MPNVLVAILLLGVLIAIHEAGHYLAARLSGMRVERFSLGFGPALATFTRGETEWRIGALPFGGYVKIAGMNPGDDVAPDDPRSYANKPAWMRLAVILAGAIMNFVLAWALFFGLLLAGLDVPTTKVGGLVEGMPAAAAGLLEGDRIVAVGGAPTRTFSELSEAMAENAGKPTTLSVERGGERLELPVTPTEAGLIGVRPSDEVVEVAFGPGEAAVRASYRVVNGILGTIATIVALVSGTAEGNLMGPIGITSEIAKNVHRGVTWLLGIAASLSIALGFFNLLPVPALDGGRAVFLGVEVVRRKPIDARAEAWIHGVGFLLLLGLILAVSVGDVGRLFRGEPAAKGEAADAGTPAPDAGTPAPDAGSPAP